MQPLLIASVRHTGTVLLRNIVARAGYRWVGLREEPGPGIFSNGHTYDRDMGLIQDWADRVGTMVIPLRDPKQVARSWAKRQETENWDEQWANLFWLARRYPPLWVPVDSPERDRALAAVSERLGVDLRTDWCRENASPRPETGRMMEYEHLYAHPVIRRFYPE